MNDISNEHVLPVYKTCWDNYKKLCRLVDGICFHINLFWARREVYNGRRDVYEIKVVCFI